ncbi:hypothetical protein AAK967_00165 [Atopobiaceae bacterium 24-176]
MRTYADLCAAVRSTGVRYYRVGRDADDTSKVPMPFCLIVPEDSEDVMADGSNYTKATSYRVELYERGSRLDLERSFEDALEAAGFPYTRRCVPLEHGVVEMAYYLTVLGR